MKASSASSAGGCWVPGVFRGPLRSGEGGEAGVGRESPVLRERRGREAEGGGRQRSGALGGRKGKKGKGSGSAALLPTDPGWAVRRVPGFSLRVGVSQGFFIFGPFLAVGVRGSAWEPQGAAPKALFVLSPLSGVVWR